MFEDYPDILTVTDAAKILLVCNRTVYNLIRDRKLGYIRIGTRIIIPKMCLIEYVNLSIDRHSYIEKNCHRKEI